MIGRLTSNRLQTDFDDELRDDAARLALDPQLTSDPHLKPQLRDLTLTGKAAVRAITPVGSVTIRPEQRHRWGRRGPRCPRGRLDAGGDCEHVHPRVQYGRNTDNLDATISKLWLFLGGGVLGGTLLAGLAGIAIGRRAMRPVSTLTTKAREIASTRDPSLRIPEPETDDEVGELARTLEQMLRELDAARSETEQMMQAQREFVADASHELRTPLTSILANLELLQDRLESAGAARRGERDDRLGPGVGEADEPAGLRPAAARPRRRRPHRCPA